MEAAVGPIWWRGFGRLVLAGGPYTLYSLLGGQAFVRGGPRGPRLGDGGPHTGRRASMGCAWIQAWPVSMACGWPRHVVGCRTWGTRSTPQCSHTAFPSSFPCRTWGTRSTCWSRPRSSTPTTHRRGTSSAAARSEPHPSYTHTHTHTHARTHARTHAHLALWRLGHGGPGPLAHA